MLKYKIPQIVTLTPKNPTNKPAGVFTWVQTEPLFRVNVKT